LRPSEQSDLPDLLAACETVADFAEYDRIEAEVMARESSHDRFDIKTLSEVAEFFGLDEHTVRTWRLKTPPMPGESGKWPIKQIVQWRCNWIQQTDLAAAKRQQDFELGQIQVESKRLELDREKGLILDQQDVELWASTALIELREGIMQLPEMLAASAPQELKDFTREETDRHCRDLLTATHRRLEMAEIGKEGSKE
jgi:hypothetical protein